MTTINRMWAEEREKDIKSETEEWWDREEDFLTWESETAVQWTSDARQRVLMLAHNCSSFRCSSGGRLWSPARRRDNLPTLSLMSVPESWSRTRCGRGERSSRAPGRGEMEVIMVNKLDVNSSNSKGLWWVFFLQEVRLSQVRWHSSKLWCSLWEPEVG